MIDSASALYPVTSAFVHALYPESAVEFDGSDFTKDSRLQMRNTVGAYRAVVDGDSDIVVCAAPSEQQLQYAEQQGVQLRLVPIGREAFVFLTSSRNPVTSLTLQQIRGIYAGDYTFWSQLGGPHTPILPLQRAEGAAARAPFCPSWRDSPQRKITWASWVPPSAFPFGFMWRTWWQTGMSGCWRSTGCIPTWRA